MERTELLLIIILLAATVLAGTLLRRARLPAVLAYLLSGILVGPHGLAWISNSEQTKSLAEFGIVFLLFTLGLEFSLPRLKQMKREVLFLGGAQVAITTLMIASLAYARNVRPGVALVLGATFAMYSTAVVVKQLADQKELSLVHGRRAVAVLLFQDLAVIPFLILIPQLANRAPGSLGVSLEASLMVVFHLLTLLHVPAERMLHRIRQARANRYSMLRSVFRGQGARPMLRNQAFRGQLETVTLDESYNAVGHTLSELNLGSLGVDALALQRAGVVGRQPEPGTGLQNKDTLVLYGTAEALEAGKAQLLHGAPRTKQR